MAMAVPIYRAKLVVVDLFMNYRYIDQSITYEIKIIKEIKRQTIGFTI